jgi:hypothetical protein
MNVGGKNPNVTAAIIRMSVLSLRVRRATLFQSRAIDRITELSCKLNSANWREAAA